MTPPGRSICVCIVVVSGNGAGCHAIHQDTCHLLSHLAPCLTIASPPTQQYYTRDGTDNADNPHHHIDLFIEKVLVFYKPIASDEVLDGSGIEARGTG